jgi:hypothetical protein
MSIFEQTTLSLKQLMAAVESDANPIGICVAYVAILDQCAAAVRDAERTPGSSTERFEGLAAAASAEAVGPIVDAVGDGRRPERELRMPKEAAWWIARAFTAHRRGDRVTAGRYLLNAATLAERRPEGPQESSG